MSLFGLSPLFIVSCTVSQKEGRSAVGAYMAAVCMTDMSGSTILKAKMSLFARLSMFESVHPDRLFTRTKMPLLSDGVP